MSRADVATPDYLPARMLNEYVYCPRLFYYEWVEGVFTHNRHTVEGALRHARLDDRQDPLTPSDEVEPDDQLHARSVQLSSEAYRLIARMDLVEAHGDHATPVDYKHGAPRVDRDTGALAAWDADRAQIAAQALVLRDNGYRCDELRPLYLNTQGLHVGRSGNVLKVKEKDRVVQEVRIAETCQVNLFGGIQLTTQAIQALCENEVPIGYFSMGGWFYGVTQGLGVRNIALRKHQFRLADDPDFCLQVARSLIVGKIRNQRTMLQRNHVEPPPGKIAQMKVLCDDAETAPSFETLLGLEGNAARIYFELFPGMIKVGQDPDDPATAAGSDAFSFDFTHRNRRPPRDPVNALLSLAYSVLAKDLTIVCHAVGFDPFLGFYHQPRFGRAPLPLDLMEPFRPLIADSAVLSAINTRMITPKDFIRVGQAVALRPDGRKAFFRAYEQRMDTLVTHPLFGYRLNYRRMLEVQTRLLARMVTGEIATYPVFVTR
jgi:CRISPR-associated protein Cas1